MRIELHFGAARPRGLLARELLVDDRLESIAGPDDRGGADCQRPETCAMWPILHILRILVNL
jgi:hypothetical protein